jgi:hypothetical protein
MPAKNKSVGLETWLSIANLLVSIIVGIFITIYINYRNEQLQVQLVKLQSEIQRQSNLAKLEIQQDCPIFAGCNGAIKIKNNGLAAATNIRVVVIINDVQETWRPSISGVENFSLMQFPQSISAEIQKIKVDTPYHVGNGFNAFQVNIKSLPPQAEITFVLSPSQSMPAKTLDFQKTIVFYEPPTYTQYTDNLALNPINTGLFFSKYLESIDKYLINQFWIAGFSANATCDNCESIAALNRFIVSIIGTTYSYEAKDVKQTPSGVYIWEINFTGNYKIPTQVDTFPIPLADYLEIKQDPDTNKVQLLPASQK